MFRIRTQYWDQNTEKLGKCFDGPRGWFLKNMKIFLQKCQKKRKRKYKIKNNNNNNNNTHTHTHTHTHTQTNKQTNKTKTLPSQNTGKHSCSYHDDPLQV